MMPTNHPSSERGFTIVEMVVAAAVLLVLSLMITQLAISGQNAQRYANRLGRVTEVTQRSLDEVQNELRTAVRVFSDNALGLGYRDRLAPWLGFDPIRSSRLPTVSPSSTFRKDTTGNLITGNELLYARHAWSDSYLCASGKSYRVDIYRLERVYIKVEGSGPNTPGGALNLCRWTSEPLASSSQVERILDLADRKEFLDHLRDATPDVNGDTHDPITVVWKFAEDPAVPGTFRQILNDGSLNPMPQAPRKSTWEIEQSPKHSIPGLFFPHQASVAGNNAAAVHGLSRFAIQDDSAGTGAGFPHGFEVQVIGPPSARKILIHLTTMSTGRDLRAAFDTQVVVHVREG